MSTPASASSSSALTARRTQYRVGHGGFHTTIVTAHDESFVYVYDVGATPKKSLVRGAIDDFVSQLTTMNIAMVDYLILSHIDEDHVNCFAELARALDDASIAHPTVMLPWLEPTEKLFALAHANHRDHDAVAVALAGDDGEVVAYLQNLGFNDVAYVLPPGGTDADPPDGSRFVAAGTDLAANYTVPWTLLTTRIKPDLSTLADFHDRIVHRTGLDPDSSADRETLVKKHRRDIRSSMRAAAKASSLSGFGSSLTNWSSLSIFGAAPSPTTTMCTLSAPGANDLSADCDHGWLHTGDLPLDIRAVWNAFDHVWQQHNLPSMPVCALAAPHHGSPHGHNPQLFSTFSPKYVLYLTGWTAGSARSPRPIYAKKINPAASKRDATAAGAHEIELNNP